MNKLFLLISFCFIINNIEAQTFIYGKQPTYKNYELIFYTFSDPFTGNDIEVGRCTTDSSGNFSVELPIDETLLVYTYLGIFKGYIYVEPKKSYEILFPDKQEKTPADRLNPFFEPVEFHFSIKNQPSDDINNLIIKFDTVYYKCFEKIIKNPLGQGQNKKVDSLSYFLINYINKDNNDYVRNHAIYKIGLMRYLVNHQKVKSLSLEYFETRPIIYNNPAYFDLFNKTYQRYFYFFGQTKNGQKIFSDINEKKSYYELCNTLRQDKILKNDTLRELVIIKNIHDEFYSSNFSRSGLINILDSLISKTKVEKNRKYGICVKNKLTRLLPGNDPPQFALYDKNNKLVNLSDFKGKYVYLCFCSCNSYACMNEFDLLKKISKKYTDKLVIITVSIDDTYEEMTNYIKNNDYDWIFLHYGNQPNIIKEYDIRGFPTYFLIGPDGKLIFSPAKAPNEYFEIELFKIMKSRGDL